MVLKCGTLSPAVMCHTICVTYIPYTTHDAGLELLKHVPHISSETSHQLILCNVSWIKIFFYFMEQDR